jgi:hypothetical protein
MTPVKSGNAWVFVYDEQYYSSTDNEISSNNAIAYTTVFFNVASKSPEIEAKPSVNIFFIASQAASAGLLLISIYGLFIKLAPWIDTHSLPVVAWWDNNHKTVIISIVVLAVYLGLLLLNLMT